MLSSQDMNCHRWRKSVWDALRLTCEGGLKHCSCASTHGISHLPQTAAVVWGGHRVELTWVIAACVLLLFRSRKYSYHIVKILRNKFSAVVHPPCKEHYRRSFIPTAIRLFNSNTTWTITLHSLVSFLKMYFCLIFFFPVPAELL